MKPYPCKAAYAAGSRDARVLPSCFHSLDDMSADGYATLRNEALYIQCVLSLDVTFIEAAPG